MQAAHKNGSTPACRQDDHREWIKGRVITALAHFWREDVDPRLASAMTSDWLNALEKFEQDKIQTAFLKHLEASERRPTIAGIVSLITGVPTAEKIGANAKPQVGATRVRNGKEEYYAGEPGWLPEYG